MNYHKSICALCRFFEVEYEIDFYIFLTHLLNQALMQTLWLIYISLIWYSTGLLGEASETNGAN